MDAPHRAEKPICAFFKKKKHLTQHFVHHFQNDLFRNFVIIYFLEYVYVEESLEEEKHLKLLLHFYYILILF